MRFAFKTTYDHDLGLFRDPVQRRWYAALLAAVLLLPWAVPDYLSDVSLVFIYGLCGLSLMVLAGYTGLVSLGHAAFLGIGAYAHVYFAQDLRLPWVVSFVLIIQEVFTRWDRVTGCLKGKPVDKAVVFGVPLGGYVPFYFLCLLGG